MRELIVVEKEESQMICERCQSTGAEARVFALVDCAVILRTCEECALAIYSIPIHKRNVTFYE